MDPREAKLPAWVRSEFLHLRNRVGELERTLSVAREEALKTGACTGKVMADGMLGKAFPLHDRALVEFFLPDGKVSCMLRENGTLLDLNASGRMLIRPQASNSAYVEVER